MKAQNLPLEKALDRFFTIPDYQRPYSWTDKEVKALVQDLYRGYRGGGPYFLGSIVLVRDSDAVGCPSQVIDGQQRLTTLFILLRVIMELAQEPQTDEMKALRTEMRRKLFDDGNAFQGIPPRFRLQNQDEDFLFLTECVLKLTNFLPVTCQLSVDQEGLEECASSQEAGDHGEIKKVNDSHYRLYRCAELLHEILENVKHRGELTPFCLYLLNKCFLVVMECCQEKQACEIFYTLNSRGMELSIVDRLKPLLFKRFEEVPGGGERERNETAKMWNIWQRRLGYQRFGKLFRTVALMHINKVYADAPLEKVPQSDSELLDFYDKKLFNSGTHYHANSATLYDVTSFFNSLWQMINSFELISGHAFYQLTNSQYDQQDRVKQRQLKQIDELMMLLNQHESHDWEPAVVRFFCKVTDLGQRLKFMQLVEKMTTILEFGNSDFEKHLIFNVFTKVKANIEGIKADELDDHGLITADMWRERIMAPFEEVNLHDLKLRFEYCLVQTSFFDNHLFMAKYILLCLEVDQNASLYDRMYDCNGLKLNFDQIEVDLVYPLHPDKAAVWNRQYLPPPQPDCTDNWKPAQRHFRGSLGNLALAVTPTGAAAHRLQELQNGDWCPQKKQYYEGTGATKFFSRTKELCQNDTFTYSECRNRAAAFFELLAARYDLDKDRMLRFWWREGAYRLPYQKVADRKPGNKKRKRGESQGAAAVRTATPTLVQD